MFRTFTKRLALLQRDAAGAATLAGGLIGLEKESLRVAPEGGIAQTPHPTSLGSALTHPYITTDYSEALLELITPPLTPSVKALDFLRDAHKFVYDHLGDEFIWATSMPCILHGADAIPIGYYGESNAGVMKTVYRRGLGHRYGRVMQVIAGVHFNYSVPDAFWPVLARIDGAAGDSREYRDRAYFGMIRNIQRFGWIIPYLFGASPAVCKSFLDGEPTTLEEFEPSTYYQPYATSLRMGDIGYQNSREFAVGIKANYDSLDAYVASLQRAISTPCPQYEAMGVVVDGQYEQLNANILQIENEYYSSVRPKQVLHGNEKPTVALKQRGVRYVELRSVDVNAFHPLGVESDQLLFLEAFMLFCLLADSPFINATERIEIDRNLLDVAQRGRDPALRLLSHGRQKTIAEWGGEVFERMADVCALLDAASRTEAYQSMLARQMLVIADPTLTPSARMLAEMRDRDESFYAFARRMSQQHLRHFQGLALDPNQRRFFEGLADESLARQAQMEAEDQLPFDEFLAAYFAQS